MKKKVQVFPSILSGDFGRLAEEAKRLEEVGADGIHIDIMDGHFVPNLTLGPKAVGAIRKATSLFLDVHLMIYNPFDYIERFIESGADRITFHFEATEAVSETIDYIRKGGVQAGLAFCPETSPEMVVRYLDQANMILLMTVAPGFGGQSFLKEVLTKITFVKKAVEVRKLSLDIQVDGGITQETAKLCVAEGANLLVAGTYLYSMPDMKEGISLLKNVG